MDYRRNDGKPMSKQQAMNDALRRQTNELRNASSSAERINIQKRYTAEKLDIMRNYNPSGKGY